MARSALDIIINITKKGKGDKATVKALGQIAAAAGVAIAAAGAMKAAFDFAKEGAQITRLRDASSAMAKQFGQNMNDIVAAMRDASNNTINEMELMGAAARGLQLGVAKTPEEFAKLSTAAIALGRAMGRGPVDAINDITTGIGRMSPLILDNLGILTKDMPKGLSDLEKKQFLYNKTLAAAEPLLDKNGELIKDSATSYEQMAVAIDDTKASMMEIVNVGLSGEFSWILELLVDMSRQWELQAWAVQNNVDMFALSAEGMDNLTTAFNNAKDGVGGLGSELQVTDSWLEKLNGTVSTPKVVLEGETTGAIDPGVHPLDAAQNLKNMLDSMHNKTTLHKIKIFIEESTKVTGMGGESEFQHGGTFTVPGGFSNDSFRMGVSSGEQVNVNNRDERSFFGGANVNINNGTDLEGFEALLRQIQ